MIRENEMKIQKRNKENKENKDGNEIIKRKEWSTRIKHENMRE